MEQHEFDKLVQQLRSGDNEVIKMIFQEYSVYCIKALVFKYGCSIEDAKDIYMDSILNFRDNMIIGKISKITEIQSYLYATCKNMFLEKLRKAQRINNAVSHLNKETETSSYQNESSYYESKILLIEVALENLDDKCKALLKSFYYDRLALEDIAKKFNFLNANVAKVTKARCFQKLVAIVRGLPVEQ